VRRWRWRGPGQLVRADGRRTKVVRRAAGGMAQQYAGMALCLPSSPLPWLRLRLSSMAQLCANSIVTRPRRRGGAQVVLGEWLGSTLRSTKLRCSLGTAVAVKRYQDDPASRTGAADEFRAEFAALFRVLPRTPSGVCIHNA
jgi:hypothetical protein